MIKPLTPEERKKAREAFNAVMDTHDDDPLAIAATITMQSLLETRKRRRREAKEESLKPKRQG